MLGVDASVGNFTSCSNKVGYAFAETMDINTHQTQFYVAELLERGIRALIYVGTYDWICNWVGQFIPVGSERQLDSHSPQVGNERFTLAMEWSGQSKFAAQELRQWTVDGHKAGVTRSAEGLTFATIDGAGHMVPHDKPAEALALLQRWLAKEEI